MDVNGTRFHLFLGEADWKTCREEVEPGGPPRIYWDRDSEALTLNPVLKVFPRGRDLPPLPAGARRGAATDRYGSIYWISTDRQAIYWVPAGTRKPIVYWRQGARPAAVQPGEFSDTTPDQSLIVELAGLAVTEHNYMVAGDVTRNGLLVFDLHSGGEARSILFPEAATTSPPAPPLQPFDIAAAPDGGVWILDRANRAYWGLDRNFRVVTDPALMRDLEPAPESAFKPAEGDSPATSVRRFPEGFRLDAVSPVSIEGLPDGSVLILDSPVDAVASTLYHYRLGAQLSPPMALEEDVEVFSQGEGRITRRLSVTGYDMAYVPAFRTLYVVERDGKQAIAFELDLESHASPPVPIRSKRDFLPMHFFGARALLSSGDRFFYDVVAGDRTSDSAVRWVNLQEIDEPRYDPDAAIVTPILDGKERDCVWHRLLLDACIPAESAVKVSTRANNDRGLVEGMPFSDEPLPYLRSRGSEIPFAQPPPSAEGSGTWELLFQRAHGRYLQIRLELSGNGGVTPVLRALRAYYPRFSYPKRYLPAVYLEDSDSAWFLDRFLANFEGSYTDLEGKMNDVVALFDPRSAPPEALDWLAGWIGVVLDPLWARIQERRSSSRNRQIRPSDRRRLFIQYALKLFERRGTANGIKFALHLLLDPNLEILIDRFRAARYGSDPSLRDELARMGLGYPTPGSTEQQIEDLLYEYVMSPLRPSKVRLVERYMSQRGRAAVEGDPEEARRATVRSAQAATHRFSVLVPEVLSAEESAMVRRIVDLEKPAHTDFDMRRYWDMFRVGEARLGFDTALGEESRFVPMVVGRDYLAEGYLAPGHPMDVEDRIITDRDRFGEMPPL